MVCGSMEMKMNKRDIRDIRVLKEIVERSR